MNKLKKLAILIQDKIKAFYISLIRDDESKFSYIYKNRYWTNDKDGSLSGSGSSEQASQNLVNELNNFIAEKNIRSILDIPCGDWKWMPNIDMRDIKYTGGDIVQDIVTANQQKYSNSNIHFKRINLSRDSLVSSDLIIVRDLLVHLKNDDIFKCLENIKNHNIRYIGLTHYPNTTKNRNPIWGDRWRPLNMLIDPFNLNEPDYILSDSSNDGSIDEDRVMAIWKKNNFKEPKKRIKKATLSKNDTDYIIDKEIIKLLTCKKYDKVLDIGAGSSPFRDHIACSTYVTADVAYNNENSIDVLLEPNKPIPIDDEKFDLIILTDVLAHVADYKLLIRECYRILKKGGDIIVSTPFIYRENETPNDMIRFTSFGLYYELKSNHFVDISIEKIGNTAYTIYCSLNECHVKNNEIIETSLFGKIIRRIGNLILLPLLNRTIFSKKPNSNSSYFHHLIARASK